MQLIALAIAPGIAICLFIFHRDAYNREPKVNLIISFVLGAVTVIPAAFIERALMNSLSNSIGATAIMAFLIVALTEEMGKFLVLRFYAFRRKSFDEPLDGIVYAIMVGMGFATLENLLYVYQSAQLGQGYQVAFMRMFLAVPAHATFAVLMGYHAGRAKFDLARRAPLLLLGLFWAVVFHGAYDFFLFLQGNPNVSDSVSDGLLIGGAIISFIIAIRLSFKMLSKHRRLSQRTYKPTETMSLRKASPKDIALIRDLTFRIWPATYASILSKPQIDYMLELMYNEKTLLEQMEKGDEFVIVYDEKEPTGFAAISRITPQLFKLQKLYVLPSQQGRGTGRFIIEELTRAMKNVHTTTLQLNVNRQNKAKDFYEKLGFVIKGEEDVDIGGGYFMNDYVMEKAI
jgi:RsiW-degrading membrane proteinase PrsW (M82 family)/ribosomal protein S18 acetylase RimI-like enzyme